MERTLPPGGEFRMEVEAGSAVTLRLLPETGSPSDKSGRAECMGMELAQGVDYVVGGPIKCAIFSYDGCRLLATPVESPRSIGRGSSATEGCSVEYVSTENEGPMHAYLNTHLGMETLRESMQTPLKTLVLGTGRNTVARILTNYAVRMGRPIILTDLDPASGSVLAPGLIAAHQVVRPLSLCDGWWGCSAGDGQPLSYFYGGTSIRADDAGATLAKARRLHYSKICARMANTVDLRLSKECESLDSKKHGGQIIIGPGDADEALCEELQGLFRPHLVLVVGDERLHATLMKTSASQHLSTEVEPKCTLLKVPRPSGIVTRDSLFRRALIQAQFARFFYGPNQEYSPMTVNVPFDDVSIRRLSEGGKFLRLNDIYISFIDPRACFLPNLSRHTFLRNLSLTR